jgi:MFS family permease
MGRFTRFLGFKDPNEKIQKLVRIISILLPVTIFSVMLSSTFQVIFIAEALGNGDFITGMTYVGVLVVIQLGVQTLLDYPTGAIGDWIGQRYILSTSFMTSAVVFFAISLVSTQTPFWFFIIIYVLNGFAVSQMSGAFQAWFDNNYRIATMEDGVDEGRQQYGIFWGKLGSAQQIIATGALIPGSLLAAIWGRPWVFQFQAIASVIIAIAAFVYIRDFPEVEEAREKRPSMGEYVNLLKSGVSFLFSDPFIKSFLIGTMLCASTIMTWGNLVLFPFYYLYLVTDVAVASVRTVLFFPGIVWQERSGVWSQRFEAKKWIPRFRLLQTCGMVFFIVISIIMTVLPPPVPGSPTIQILVPFTDFVFLEMPQASLLPMAVIMTAFISTGVFGSLAQILTQRLLVDAVPNKIRNSLYSLQPTIGTILAIPQIAVFGFLIPIWGFPMTLVSMGLISLLGVLLIRRGFNYPVLRQDDLDQPSEEEDLFQQSVDETVEDLEAELTAPEIRNEEDDETGG